MNNPRVRRAARHQPPNPEVEAAPRSRRRRTLISVEQIVDTALSVIAGEGYEALTMRRLAGALDTGPASLYAHVVNKADLDELLIGRLCAELYAQIHNEDWSLLSGTEFQARWPQHLWNATKHYQYMGEAGAFGAP